MKNEPFDFTNKTIQITDGSTGIGGPTALTFARRGAISVKLPGRKRLSWPRKKAPRRCS